MFGEASALLLKQFGAAIAYADHAYFGRVLSMSFVPNDTIEYPIPHSYIVSHVYSFSHVL